MLQQVAKRSLGLLARAGTRSFAAEAAPAAVASDIGYVSQVRPLATSTTQICSSGTAALLQAFYAVEKRGMIASVWPQQGVHSSAARVLVLLAVSCTERGEQRENEQRNRSSGYSCHDALGCAGWVYSSSRKTGGS